MSLCHTQTNLICKIYCLRGHHEHMWFVDSTLFPWYSNIHDMATSLKLIFMLCYVKIARTVMWFVSHKQGIPSFRSLNWVLPSLSFCPYALLEFLIGHMVGWWLLQRTQVKPGWVFFGLSGPPHHPALVTMFLYTSLWGCRWAFYHIT